MGTVKPPAKRDGDAHSLRGEVMAALSGHYITFCNGGECRLLVRVVDQLYFRFGNEARRMTATFMRTGLLPDGTRILADIGLSERGFRDAQQGIDSKWPGLIPRYRTLDEYSRPVYWWSFNAPMFLTCPQPRADALTETQKMAIKPVARPMAENCPPPRQDIAATPGEILPTPPAENCRDPRRESAALNTGYKSGLEIRTEIRPTTSSGSGDQSDFKIGFSLSGNDTPPDFTTTASDRIRAIAGQAAADKASTRATKTAKARAKPVAARRIADVEGAWTSAVANHCPNAPSVLLATPADRAQVKRMLASWDERNGDVFDLIDFSVREWSGLIGNTFGWMTKARPPEHPDMGFFAKHWQKFATAHIAGRHYAMADDKRTELQRLMGEGKSEAQAQAILDERARAPHVRARRAPAAEQPSWTNPNWKGRKAQ